MGIKGLLTRTTVPAEQSIGVLVRGTFVPGFAAFPASRGVRPAISKDTPANAFAQHHRS
jgi:hypothetical protein